MYDIHTTVIKICSLYITSVCGTKRGVGTGNIYVERQSSRTRHCVLAVAALGKNLSMVWWRWHISVLQMCCCWSMAVSFWVASITVCVCFGVPPRECRNLN